MAIGIYLNKPMVAGIIGKPFGYIAGISPGIVTVAGKPSRKVIYLYEHEEGASRLKLVEIQVSRSNGEYRFDYLNTSKKYLVMAVDETKQYEPVAWDWVTPAVTS